MSDRLDSPGEHLQGVDKALAWAALGLRVHPVREKDSWSGDKLFERKTPYLTRGLTDAITNPEGIRAWWAAQPDALVGVVADSTVCVLDIDMNAEKGKDGWNSLVEADLSELPDTFSYKTSSGGEHHVYRHPHDVELGPAAPVVISTGEVLTDVDRRAGRSYFIAWGDSVPTSLDELAPAPEWLCVPSSSMSESPFHGSIADWVRTLRPVTSYEVSAAKVRFPRGEFGHDEMIQRQAELVRLAAEGKGGVAGALDLLRARWLQGEFNTPEYADDFDRSLAGAVRKFGGTGEPDSPEVVEAMTDELANDYYIKLKAQQKAKRRLASENFTGTEFPSWEEMEAASQTFLIEDLVPEQGMVFLIAKRNIGKTFLYIDAICSMAFGMRWLGKETKQTKTMVVIGEGFNGYVDRLKAWCEAHGEDFEELKKWVIPVRGANLNNETSLELLREKANAEEVGLIIFDTFANTSGGTDENDAALNSMTLEAAVAIRAEATTWFIHHPRRSDQDTDAPIARGSGALDGRADVVLTMYRDKSFSPTSGSKQEWLAVSTEEDHAGKNRSARTETIRGLYLNEVSENAVMRQVAGEGLSKRVRRVREKLSGVMTRAEYRDETGLSEESARLDIEEAVEAGVLEVSSEREGRKPATFMVKRPVGNHLALVASVPVPKNDEAG
ncbi:AAA family ATPase [Microcella humidisoli]|uniref:AAA family ATPase n=1 Tax=Microcella humidisoli TaxID=2963406 RepID=A0ABY5FW66_9MICO|nr:AAA family ATPase [Microcella humidisoli]UTT62551.1 AAA family ATPase [Microcella humidisoli]UTT63840.1 AAA family ATPase [Microcella humidisoli]